MTSNLPNATRRGLTLAVRNGLSGIPSGGSVVLSLSRPGSTNRETEPTAPVQTLSGFPSIWVSFLMLHPPKWPRAVFFLVSLDHKSGELTQPRGAKTCGGPEEEIRSATFFRRLEEPEGFCLRELYLSILAVPAISSVLQTCWRS